MISYKKRTRYKYTLVAEYQIATNIIPDAPIDTGFIKLDRSGQLTLCRGYAWDGASGPAPDIPNIMRASLVHDALYQLLREELIAAHYRANADRLLQRICLQAGMPSVLAWLIYQAVRLFGASSATPDTRHAP